MWYSFVGVMSVCVGGNEVGRTASRVDLIALPVYGLLSVLRL